METQQTAPLAHAIPDACRRLGLSRSTVYGLISAGELKAFKVGSRTLLSESELRRFIAEKSQGMAA